MLVALIIATFLFALAAITTLSPKNKPLPQSAINYKIIEVERPRTPEAMDTTEVRAMLATLQSNPGLLYILGRLKAQKSLMETTLKTTHFEKLEEVINLQSGIFWAGWLEAQINSLTKRATPEPAAPYDFELEAFKEIDSQLERVGKNV